MKMHWITLAAMVTLAGCASVRDTYTTDGRKAYALNCSGTARGWDKCFAAAGDICKSAGYDILDRTSEESTSIGASRNGMFGTKSNERSMVIACK